MSEQVDDERPEWLIETIEWMRASCEGETITLIDSDDGVVVVKQKDD